MSAQKHTPGPWERKGQTAEGARFFGTFHRVHADGAWVSFVPMWGNVPAEAAEAEANARLIAAAPDLLAAAESALNFIANTEGEMGIALESGDKLRAAIAKATEAST